MILLEGCAGSVSELMDEKLLGVLGWAFDHILKASNSRLLIFNQGHGTQLETSVAHIDQLSARIRK